MRDNKLLKTAFFISVTAATIYGINRVIFSITDKMSALTKSKEGKYPWKYGEISYTRQGSGTPILLIHDLHSGNYDIEWKYIVEDLAQTHEVYTIDLLGCGKSDKPAITYNAYIYMQLIHDFIKDVIEEKTNVIATGTSAMIPLITTLEQSHMIEKILLVNPISVKKTNQGPTTNSKLQKRLIELPLIGTLLYNILHNQNYYNKEFMHANFVMPEYISLKIPTQFYVAAHKGGANAKYLFASQIGNCLNFPVSRALMNCDVPIHCVFGEFENNGVSTQDEYISCNSQITCSTIDNAKHYPHIEQPEAFIQLCNEFFEY